MKKCVNTFVCVCKIKFYLRMLDVRRLQAAYCGGAYQTLESRCDLCIVFYKVNMSVCVCVRGLFVIECKVKGTLGRDGGAVK